jgi:hypothetical protein
MSSKGIDYSKWDRMEFSDDDDDESEDESGQPRVTRLELPSQVTLSKTGEVSIHNSPKSPLRDAVDKITVTTLSVPTASSATQEEALGIPVAWTEKGAATTLQDSGGSASSLFWTQDRQIVTLRFPIPSDRSVKNWHVSAPGILTYADRHVGVSSGRPVLQIVQGDDDDDDKCVLVQKALPQHIHGPPDAADEKEKLAVDWTIERYGDTAYIAVTLNKAAPMHGVVVWWNNPLEDATEIAMDWREKSASASGFQQAWEEAHDQFRQKMAETS